MITDKPNYITPANPTSVKGLNDREKASGFEQNKIDKIFKIESMQRSIRSAGQSMNPRLRSKYQQTSAQDYGWYADALVPKNEMQQLGLKNSPITGYMEHYVAMKQVNPFNKKVFLER